MVNLYIMILIFMFIDITATFYIIFMSKKLNMLNYDNEIGLLANFLFKKWGHGSLSYLKMCFIIGSYFTSLIWLWQLFFDLTHLFYLLVGSYSVIFLLHSSNIKYYSNLLKDEQKHIPVLGMDNKDI